MKNIILNLTQISQLLTKIYRIFLGVDQYFKSIFSKAKVYSQRNIKNLYKNIDYYWKNYVCIKKFMGGQKKHFFWIKLLKKI